MLDVAGTARHDVDGLRPQVLQANALACLYLLFVRTLGRFLVALRIREDIRDQYASLLGAKTVHGRTLVVEDLIAEMTAAVGAELP